MWQKTEDGGWFLPFETNKGSEYSIDVYKQTMMGAPVHDIQFSDSSGSFAVTGAGSAKEVFGKVTTALLSHLQKENPTAASFSAAGKSRQSLYDKLTKTIAVALPEYTAMAYSASGYRQYMVVKRSEKDRYMEYAARKGIEPETLVMSINPSWFSMDSIDKITRMGL